MSEWNNIVDNIKVVNFSDESNLFVYQANISIKYNYMFVETPKTGCSTIKRTLINAELGSNIDYADFEDLHKRIYSPLLNPLQVGSFRKFLENCKFKFCFVRNPYSRILSAYLDKIMPAGAYRRDEMARYLSINDSDINFSEFVRYICSQSINQMDPHWRVQYQLNKCEYIDYDFIGKFENLESDLRVLLQKIGISFDSCYEIESRHATSANTKLEEYYNKELKYMIYSKYKCDFDTFGYEA